MLRCSTGRTSTVEGVMGLHRRVGLPDGSGSLALELLVRRGRRVSGLLRRRRGIDGLLGSSCRGA